MYRIVFLFVLTLAASTPAFAQVQGQVIKVLSYNIHHGENMQGKLDIQGIATVILAVNPDLVALQEVDSSTSRVNKADQLKELAAITGMYVYFGKAMEYDGGGFGNGILSRYPIEKTQSIALPAKGEGSEPRNAAMVTVKLPGDSLLRFVSAHLDHLDDPADRLAQVNIILQHTLAQPAVPLIVAGDMNALPASKEIGILKQHFTDATEKLGPTWPADKPEQKIDYVFLYNKTHWHVMSSQVLEETVASDHRPVIAEVLLK
ncbi:endonuclease/exonuclease/phosphatase family protein [Chitinophaga sp. GCM10012297]|uniref:Endonuclease/exonuclease/phosphatase family protein n=1 Tax=Chitinophaga chungangae TaxID=2821488 RepID=A0ABS3YK90_9BACT|nr:endonuclease/exonuclease/phosphatase family protein [Chitinophaga chungangae]MBO9155105.1 endonuclease/exonuclease/phosphatase family protein [Chitinophaga chungangae]